MHARLEYLQAITRRHFLRRGGGGEPRERGVEALAGEVARRMHDRPTREILDIPDIARKWAAFGWEVLSIDGHDVSQILTALGQAQKTKGRPTVIVAETVKGKGFSFAENNAAFHNGALTADQYRQALSELEARRAELAD